jgi:hypothetical protein
MKRINLFPNSLPQGPTNVSRCPSRLLPITCSLFALLTFLSPAQAQTSVDITYNKDTGGGGTIVTETFLGAFCRVPLALETVRTGVAGAFFIVRPVNDPVLEFNSFEIRNNTAVPWYGLVFSVVPLPIGDPRRTMFGFVDDSTTATGTGSGASTFSPTFSGALGLYNGDALLYTGLPIYSRLTFTGGNLAIGDTGTFNLLNAIPPPDQNNYMVFVSPLAAPEPSTLGLFALGSLVLIARRRK